MSGVQWTESLAPLVVDPPTVEADLGSTRSFSIAGGLSPYTVTLLSGAGQLEYSEPTFTYAAPNAEEEALFLVEDSKGAKIYGKVSVVDNRIPVPPPVPPPPPLVTIELPAQSFIVNQQTKDNLLVEGTCSENDLPVQVYITSTILATPVCTSGRFTASVSLASFADGILNISVLQKNALAIDSAIVTVTGTKDVVAPTVPANFASQSSTAVASTSAKATWDAATDPGGSGIDFYELSVGTTPNGADIKGWTSVGNVNFAFLMQLILVANTDYYTSIRCRDVAGNISGASTSTAWTYIPPPFSSLIAGGNGDDYVENIFVDIQGNIFASLQATNDEANTQDVKDFMGQALGQIIGRERISNYIVKFDSSGVQQWAKWIGSATDCSQAFTDSIHAVATDNAGNVFVGGHLAKDAGCTPRDFAGNIVPLDRTSYLAKLDSNGNQLWFSTMGGDTWEWGVNGIYVDVAGDPLVSGIYYNTTDDGNHMKDFAGQPLLGYGGMNGFLSKLSGATGNQVWTRHLGTPSLFTGLNMMAITGDANRNYYLCGSFETSLSNGKSYLDFKGNPMPGRTVGNEPHGFVFKLDMAGTQQWLNTYGSNGGASGNGNLAWDMAATSAGEVYVAGSIAADLSNSNGARDFNNALISGSSPTLSTDGFVAKLAPDGSQLWAKTFGGTKDDFTRAVRLTTDGKVIVGGNIRNDSGNSLSAKGLDGGTFLGKSTEAMNMFITALDSMGNFLYTTTAGGNADSTIYSLTVTGSTVYVGGQTGVTNGTDFMGNAYVKKCTTCGSPQDAMISKFQLH